MGISDLEQDDQAQDLAHAGQGHEQLELRRLLEHLAHPVLELRDLLGHRLELLQQPLGREAGVRGERRQRGSPGQSRKSTSAVIPTP